MHNLNVKGRNSQAPWGFPGKFESSNLIRDNVSREIGRTHQEDHGFGQVRYARGRKGKHMNR